MRFERLRDGSILTEESQEGKTLLTLHYYEPNTDMSNNELNKKEMSQWSILSRIAGILAAVVLAGVGSIWFGEPSGTWRHILSGGEGYDELHEQNENKKTD